MARTNYAQGYAFENRIVKKLNEQGGLAYRTAGSHSPIDITYINHRGIVHLIQCKHSKQKDIDIKPILCDSNTLKLEQLDCSLNVVKVILLKQARSNKVIQLSYDLNNKWSLKTLFDLT